MENNISSLCRIKSTRRNHYDRAAHGSIKLSTTFGFNTVYGTALTQAKPSTLYIKTRAKITPIHSLTRRNDREIEKVQERILSMFQSVMVTNPHFEDRIIVNLDYSAKNLAAGKSVFLRYDIHLRPKKLETLAEQYNRVERLVSVVERRLSYILRSVGLQTDGEN